MNLGALIKGLFALGVAYKAAREAFADEPQESQPKQQRLAGRSRTVSAGGLRLDSHDVKTLDQRIVYIMKMIRKGDEDPRIIEFTQRLLSQKCGSTWCVPEKDWEAEVVTIFNAVRSQIRYTMDPVSRDLFKAPVRSLEWHAGDCDDFVIVLACLLRSVGYHVKLRVIRTIDAPDWNHIYLLVQIPAMQNKSARWVPLDASVDKPAGWEAPRRIIKWQKDYTVAA